MKNCLVLQSGGPTSVINSSLYGIIHEAKNHKDKIDKIYGSLYGIDGILEDEIINIDDLDDPLLFQTPGAILGSTRHNLPTNSDDNIYKNIYETLNKYNIGYLFIIGGNDSMDSANKINKYLIKSNIDIKVIGIPKTIDNDIEGIDHTPGYGSAAKYIANTIKLIKQDTKCYKKGRITVVEIMGRDAGWLTAAAALSNSADMIIVPEVIFDIDNFICKVKEIYDKNNSCLVCVSEGIKDKDGKYISSLFYKDEKDDFAHVQLGGVGNVLITLILNKLNIKLRAIELNLPQRCFSIINSKTDVNEAIGSGKYGIISALSGKTGYMVSIKRKENKDYEIYYDLVDLDIAANNVRHLDNKYIDGAFNINKSFIDYAKPLIQGEIDITFEDGIIKTKNLIK